jgi:hypothetical protein
MPTWIVPIVKVETYCGEMIVEADSQEEALNKAKYEYYFEDQNPFVSKRPSKSVSFPDPAEELYQAAPEDVANVHSIVLSSKKGPEVAPTKASK